MRVVLYYYPETEQISSPEVYGPFTGTDPEKDAEWVGAMQTTGLMPGRFHYNVHVTEPQEILAHMQEIAEEKGGQREE